MRMPGCGGADALAQIRAGDGPSRDAIAIATTADDSSAARCDLLARGFAQVLPKPVAAEALRDVVRRHLRNSVAGEPPAWIDEAQALRAAGGDRVIAVALRGLLAQELADLPGELQRFTRDVDAAGLLERLHRLDASAGICGVPPLSDAIARVRPALERTHWPHAEIAALVDTALRLRSALVAWT
jgi:FixJ family two-component response regulator